MWKSAPFRPHKLSSLRNYSVFWGLNYWPNGIRECGNDIKTNPSVPETSVAGLSNGADILNFTFDLSILIIALCKITE